MPKNIFDSLMQKYVQFVDAQQMAQYVNIIEWTLGINAKK